MPVSLFRHHASASSAFDARALVTTMAWLRPCAALGQALAVVAAMAWLRVDLPLARLGAGIAVLMLATPVAFWRLQRAWPVGEVEAFGHVTFDVLLLVPVALSAAALSGRTTAAVTLLATAVYGVLVFAFVPLPDMPMHGNGFRLHLTGMAVNFALAVVLLAVFVGRMNASLRSQRQATRHLRERALRDEGILAIATQAADAAHRLNTPLSTLRTLLPELERGRADDAALRADVALMTGEVDRCRDILREMVDYGRRQLAGTTQTTTLGEYVRANGERFRLLRPEAAVTAEVAPALRDQRIDVQPGLAHALLNLMQNALDASLRNHSNVVTLDADATDGRVEFVIGDRGGGFAAERMVGLPAASSKPEGLGIGLALARSTVERMRGEVHARGSTDGTQVCVRLPRRVEGA
jgi:two-component system sensor histidine kinase RegB